LKLLLGLLVVLGVIVSVTVVPGVFTTDDNNYLINVIALRQGRFTVANTEGLSPSRELLSFDPSPWGRAVDSTPVASTAPPLYALLALPFSSLGWRGLVALNTLAYLATMVMVFLYAQRYATEASTAWLAVAAFALGGYVIEYAQGVWPHALSIALCTGGIIAAGRGIDYKDSWDPGDPGDSRDGGNGRPSLAAAAGVLLGIATGVRYQNAVVLAVAGGALALWSPRRWKALASFVLAAAVPLTASAAINHIRLGSWNPISKGPGYLRVPLVEDPAVSLFDPLVMFWARVVDFSVRPPLLGYTWVTYDPVTGAHLMIGATLQKALLQSAPWAMLAFILFVVAWMPRFRMPDARRRQTRLLSLVALAIMMTFAFAGVSRHQGLSFNQRYLIELLPLAAIGFAWALDGLKPSVRPLLVGSLWGVLIVVLILRATPIGGGPQDPLWLLRQLALLKVPLLLSASLGVLWFVARSRERVRPLLAGAAGLCLAWGLTLHLGDDVQASHRLRGGRLAESQALGAVLTDGSALVAYTGYKDAAFPLLFNRDIVILDARADEGKDAPILIRELLDRNRRVFVLQSGFPGEVLHRVLSGWQVVRIVHPGVDLVELLASPH
jgi:hypothetical protein